MAEVKIYLAGGMTGLSQQEQTEWRMRFCDAIKYGDFDYEKKPVFFNPTQYYSMFEQYHKSEKESMDFDIYNLKKSDLVVVNFNSPSSIGTAMELMLSKHLGIPVIGLNKDGHILHPWVSECCTRICDNFRELITHIVDYYLK